MSDASGTADGGTGADDAAPGEPEPEFNPFAPPDAPPPGAVDEPPLLEGFDDYPAEEAPISPAEADRRASGARDSFSRHPELFVGAAFAGAYAAAKLLRRVGGGDS